MIGVMNLEKNASKYHYPFICPYY